MASPMLFTLEGKGLKLDTAEDIEPHLKELRDNTEVEEVRFQGNTLGIGASEALAKVLESKKTLQIANLADIFTSRLLSEIPPALSSLLTALLTLPKLHTVNLSDNAFGLNMQGPLVAFLSAHTPLKHLILNNNGLGPHAGAMIGDALTTLAGKQKEASTAHDAPSPFLETIVCGRNRLENGSAPAFSRALAAHAEALKEVRMVQNGIRQEGVTALLHNGLAGAAGLRALDLQDNLFTAKVAAVLSRVVGGWPKLRELGVGDTLLSARGGIVLADALAKGNNAQLEVLRLQYNEIGAKGVERLAEAAEKLPKLRRVELNGNRFSEDDEGVERLRARLDDLRRKGGPPMDEDTEEWGLDELDELEEESDEEDEEGAESEEDASAESTAEKTVKEADEAEEEKVSQKQDKSVDQLADLLGKTEL